MNYINLPKDHRPQGIYKKCIPGIDLPRAFIDALWSIDRDIYPVWHDYRLLWDDVINSDQGIMEDPRFTIHFEGSKMIWGFILTDNEGDPIPEGKYHLWRLCKDRGWAHIVDLKETSPAYLTLVLDSLYSRAKGIDRGAKHLVREMREQDEELVSKRQASAENLWVDVNKENSRLMDTVRENFSRGNVAPTNPQKDIIYSYKGQTNRTKITRTITDEEGGLILPKRGK